MEYPEGLTEKQFLETVEKIVGSFPPGLATGHMTIEDVRQAMRLECVKALAGYDGKRPLENFLRVHVKHRLRNLNRDVHRRIKNPCITCPHYDKNYQESINQCKLFENKYNCKPFQTYTIQSNTKNSLVEPVNMKDIADDPLLVIDEVHEKAEYALLEEEIDRRIPAEYRADYLKIREGVSVPTNRRNQIKRIILDILGSVQPDID